MVFGAWASWTNNYEEYVADVENKNYCAYEPMMYAFVIIIAKWVRSFFSPTEYLFKPLKLSGPVALPNGAHLFLWLPEWLLLRCMSCLK